MWLGAAIGAMAGAAGAQGLDRVPDTRPEVESLVERLDDPVFAARREAMRSLLGRRDLTLEEVDSWRQRPGLSAEQRLRLEELALQVFARGPHAALGIRFPTNERGGELVDVVAGFPAAELLRPGDRILAADGIPVTRQAVLRAAILSHAPGEKIALTVARDEETLEVEVELGSFRELVGSASPRPSDILAAWTLRRAREGAGAPEGARLEPATSQHGGAPPAPGSPAWELAFAGDDAPAGVVVGGQPREGMDLSLTRLAGLDASREVTLEELQLVGDADLGLQIALVRNRIERTADDIARIQGLLEGGNLDAGGRVMMRQRLAREREQLAELEEQMRLLQERWRDSP